MTEINYKCHICGETFETSLEYHKHRTPDDCIKGLVARVKVLEDGHEKVLQPYVSSSDYISVVQPDPTPTDPQKKRGRGRPKKRR